MELGWWRDIALIVIGILNILTALITAAVAFAAWRYGGKGLGIVERLLEQKVRPVLDRAEQQLVIVRDRTARLPGNASIGAGDTPAGRKRGKLPFALPFRRRRRRFPLLPS